MRTFRRVSLVVLCALTAALLEVSPAITHTQRQQVQSASANQVRLRFAQATQSEQKIDPSLIPGLQAQLKVAQDEAASASDTRDAAKKEMDQRMSEKNRWQDEIATVKKDQELNNKQIIEYNKEVDERTARLGAYTSKCLPKYPRELAAFCQSEYEYLNSWLNNLGAQKARLDQSIANIAARFSDIQKMIDSLTQRISSLTTDYMNANFKYVRATQRAAELTKVLEQQNR